MNRIAFVTGGTGLLGSWLTRSLLTHGYQQIYVLARGNAQYSAETRVYETLRSHKSGSITQQAYKKITVITGDICKPRLSLSSRIISSLLNRVTDIFHTAALADFCVPLEVIRGPNVIGTKHVLELALLLANRVNGPPLQVHHVSTIAVAGNLEGWFGEDQFEGGQRFNNSYEQSKFEAEQLVRNYKEKGLRVVIYRPGIITGDSKHGITTNFKMIYQPLHFIAHELVHELPANEHCFHSLVPVDKVAEAICLLINSSQPLDNTWHLINPYETRFGDFVDIASRIFHCQKPLLIPLEQFPRKRLSSMQWDLIKPFVPYFNYRLRFKADHTIHRLSSLGFRWPKMDDAMLAKLFRYCLQCGFIRPKC